MADPEVNAVDHAPVLDGVEDEEEGDEVFLDTTMFDEDDEWLEGALAAPEDEDDDPYYFVQARTTGPKADIYHAARVGDLERIKHLVEEEEVDVNRRDRWDSVPLYYACLAGQSEVAEYLLEAGAVCNEYTFDGDRCHYAALTSTIRALLRQYEQRPPPLAPLAASLRSLSTLCDDLESPGITTRREEAPWCDFAFEVAGERITMHRAIMAARSPFMRRMLLTDWHLPEDSRSSYRTVNLKNAALSATALKAVLAFMYTERLDVTIEDVDAVLRVAKKCKMHAVVKAVEDEMRTLKYYFKSTRRDEAPRRFVLHPGSVPEQYRLAAQMQALRAQCRDAESSDGCSFAAGDFADVSLVAEDRTFRCHCCILTARSDYFAALLSRSELCAIDIAHQREDASLAPAAGASQPGNQSRALPTVRVSGISAAVLEVVLEFVYTDLLPHLQDAFLTEEGAEELFDAADRYLIFSMKRRVAERIMEAWEKRMPRLEPLCRMLLVADRFGVTLLRDHCLHCLAARFEALAEEHAPQREREVFEAFVAAVAPQDGEDLFDGSHIAGPSRGRIEGSGIGGAGIGTILQDLREAYLEDFGGLGEERDRTGDWFDARLQELATCAFERQEGTE